MRRIRGFILLGLLAALGGSARACIWDTDTLKMEARRFPDTVQIITGRFDRNPPLYYEMRLRRVSSEIARDLGRLNDYDDAGAACDRLGRDTEALAWMAKKRAQMERQPSAATQEDWYRYYANAGTFRVHRWLRGGGRGDIAEVRAARDDIAQAIRINPDAHFGRERYQMETMDWLLWTRGVQTEGMPGVYGRENLPGPGEVASGFSVMMASLGVYLMRAEGDVPPGYRVRDLPGMVRGLSGLIVLGNAWESVDIFAALGEALRHQGDSSMAYFAALRAKELITQGRRSSLPFKVSRSDLGQGLHLGPHALYPEYQNNVEENFFRLRAEAEKYQRLRTEYMMARLSAGRHPDTDPHFWDDWRPPRAPRLAGLPLWKRTHEPMLFIEGAIGLAVLAYVASNLPAWTRRLHRKPAAS